LWQKTQQARVSSNARKNLKAGAIMKGSSKRLRQQQVESASVLHRLLPFLFLLLAAAWSTASLAYTNQWQWQVSGDSQQFPNKGAAVARLKTLYPQLEDAEEKLQASNAETISYQYRKPPKDPTMGDWVHYVYEPSGIPYSSLDAAVAARRAKLAQSLPQCPAPNVTPVGGWVDDAWVATSPFATGSRQTILISNLFTLDNAGTTCVPSNTTWTEKVVRVRNWSCPAGYSFVYNSEPCQATFAASVFGHPLPCAENCSTGGNPIEVGTANKTQVETDYSGAGLAFIRTYNSQTLEAVSNLGIGWAHNYGLRLIMPDGSTPSGMLRADGHHDILRYVASYHYYSEVGTGLQLKKVGQEWIAYLDNGAREVYDATGKLLRLIDPRGSVTTLNYNGNFISSVVGPFGHSLQFVYTSRRIQHIVDPAGQLIQFSYGANQNLTSVTYAGATRTYHYENAAFPNSLTGITDEASSRFSTYAYDSSGRATLTEHAGGVNRFTFDYQSNSTVMTQPSGATTTFSFATGNRFRKITSRLTAGLTSASTVPAYETDFQRRVTHRTDPRGNVTQYTYNINHLASKTEAFGTPAARTTSYLYRSTNEDLPTQVDEPGRRTTITYDANANVLTRTVLDTATSVSRTWTYTYNTFGRVLTEDGPRTDASDVTTYTYYTCLTGSQCGQVQTITNALGHVTTYNAYNAHAQPSQVTDANGLVTHLAYDGRQRLTDRCVGGTLPSCAGGELTHIDYWPTGLLKKATNPDGSFIEYVYDAAHRLTEIKDGALNRSVYTLDNAGNRTAENTYDPSNALRRTHSRVFNTLNQMWKDVNAAGTAAVTTTFGYDDAGNQTTTAAPLGRNSASLYDEFNRLKQITDPASGITQFAYDARGNVTSVTDPRNLVTSYTYNGHNDLVTQTSPDSGVTTNTYDSAGNLDTSTDSRGAATDYAYDALNRVTSASFTIGGVTDQTITYGYDAGANQKGLLTSASDAQHTLAWTYDNRGRVTGKGQTVNGVTLAMGYGYDASGRLANTVLPSGSTITFGYNTNGQVTGLTLNGSTTLLNNITYDPFGPITGWTWGNATTASRGFDTDGKITQVDNASGASLKDYAYDDAFRITGITDALNASLSWTFGYSSLDRLTSATSSAATQGWTYDANGNRLMQTGTSPSTYTNSSSSNRLNSTSGSIARTYAYDNAGNALSYAGATFTYNNANRMATATNAGVTASYTYNALGQRIRRSTQANTTLYVYDEAGHLVGEYAASGSLIQETVWLGNMPVATLSPNGSGGVNVFYVHTDHLHTPRMITDTSSNIRWRWDSDAFGTSAPTENPASLGLFVYNLRFPGQQFDPIVGLNYNYFRDYDPATGRYVESDPIGLRGGVNTYAYVQGSPVLLEDAYGLLGRGPGPYANPASQRTTAGRGGAAVQTGVQGSAHLLVVGASISGGLAFVSNGQVCRTFTICIRLGPGFFYGLGGFVGGGLLTNGGEDLGGFDLGVGGDAGFGPSAGGQATIGQGTAGVTRGRGGGGWGLSLGIDFCFSHVKCDMPSGCDPKLN
jgi:RHS repeat-associated protein